MINAPAVKNLRLGHRDPRKWPPPSRVQGWQDQQEAGGCDAEGEMMQKTGSKRLLSRLNGDKDGKGERIQEETRATPTRPNMWFTCSRKSDTIISDTVV